MIITPLLSKEHDKRLYAEMVARWEQAGKAPLKLGCFQCRARGLCARCDYESRIVLLDGTIVKEWGTE